MNMDAILLGMLAIADFIVLAHLRYRRRLAKNVERVMRSMALAVRRDNIETEYAILDDTSVLAKAS